MRKFIVFTFACALLGLPLSAQADDGTLANDANGYYDFIPADQLDSSFASDAQTDSVTPNLAPQPGGPGGGNHGGPGGGGNHGGPGGPGGGGNHGGPGGNNGGHPGPQPGPGGPGGGGNHGGPGPGDGNHGGGDHGGGNHGGGGFPIPIPIPIPVPSSNWACYSRDRGGHQYEGYSFSQATARRNAMNTCERQSHAGHCRLIGCRRY